MVDIRKMRVAVGERCMMMRMAVRLAAIPDKIVCVRMMLVVYMIMRVVHRRVRVIVPVVFRQVQPHAQRHQCGGDPKRKRRCLAEKRNRHRRADKRCRGKIRAGARRAQAAQCQHEQHQADAVAAEAARPPASTAGRGWGCPSRPAWWP